ncbi:DUF412 family protein [Gallaecimonas kandeliae]|uniref:DUF412 family protein n=1 Tax=Gallaecimonas kandeliae TaxID=3029055 RepID=UPI0026489CBA|nr:DUF412 family protein [Gallaecimonas kandeliae]WKE66851.1 DUF412 family protein [Gallaecimonas kandeliae]
MWELIRDGYRLLKHWPVKSSLMLRFPLTQSVLLSRLLLYWVPGLALAWFILSMKFSEQTLENPQLMMALLLLSLPVQSLLWLGKEGRKPLTPGDRHWFNQLAERMKGQGIRPAAKVEGARYLELALVMEQAFKRGGQAFGQPD